MAVPQPQRVERIGRRTDVRVSRRTPAYQAYQVLVFAFTVAPIIAGVDKFFHFLVDWDHYLAPVIHTTLGVPGHTLMLAVGVVEIVAGLIVAMKPSVGGWIVAAWLVGIIVNLSSIPGYYDIALRDFGLALAAIALARLGAQFATREA